MHGTIFLIGLLFTIGMSCIGLAFLSFLRETIENGKLIEGYK